MRRMNLFAPVAAAMALLAMPALAQSYSDGFNFLKGVRERDAATVNALVQRPNSAILNYRDPSSGEGALHILARGRDLEWLRFLVSRGSRADMQARDGTTPLIIAAQIGWREGAEELLARGADPNLGNNTGMTPLMFAVQRLDLTMVRLLISHRADPNQTDHSSGNSAIDFARQDRRAAAILRELE